MAVCCLDFHHHGPHPWPVRGARVPCLGFWRSETLKVSHQTSQSLSSLHCEAGGEARLSNSPKHNPFPLDRSQQHLPDFLSLPAHISRVLVAEFRQTRSQAFVRQSEAQALWGSIGPGLLGKEHISHKHTNDSCLSLAASIGTSTTWKAKPTSAPKSVGAALPLQPLKHLTCRDQDLQPLVACAFKLFPTCEPILPSGICSWPAPVVLIGTAAWPGPPNTLGIF